MSIDFSNYHNLLIPIVVTNNKFETVFINRTTLKVFKYNEDELLGNNISILKIDKFDNIDKVQGRNISGYTKDGLKLTLVLSVNQLWDGNNQYYIFTFQDITDQTKLMEQNRKKIEVLQRNILTPMVVANDKLIIMYVNDATTKTFKYDKEELIGQSVKILMPSKIATVHDSYVHRYLTTHDPHIIGTPGRKVKGKTKNKKVLDLLLMINEFTENGQKFFTAVFQDITTFEKRQRKEMKLVKSFAKLKASFVANMSHEIRTPMNGIIGMLTLLTNEKGLTLVQREYIKTTLSCAENLMSILNDILLFSKAEAGSIKLESTPFDLNNLIEEVSFIMSSNIPKAMKRDVDLVTYIDTKVPINVIGDPGRLRQILMNLVSNAIKFTETGEVCIEIYLHKKNPLTIRCNVSDTGIGISREQRKKLFSKFYQADISTTRKYGGTGLGLAICKMLIDKFQGRIWVKSKEGRGSIFSFTVVLKKDPAINKLEYGLDQNTIDKLRGKRIFVIDDNATNCYSLKNLFISLGCYVEISRSGLDGIERLKISRLKDDDKFDVLLLDYHMPKLNGIDVARILNKLDFNELKIIVLSSSIDHHLIMKEPNIHACTFKPIRKSQLLYLLCHSILDEDIELTDSVKNNGSYDLMTVSYNDDKRVLVVEDNTVNRLIITKYLKKNGYEVDEAINGLEALEKIKSNNSYNIILMDIHMPVMDGLETIKMLQKRGITIPVIIITADISIETKKKIKKLEVPYFLKKPIKFDQLNSSINNLFSVKNNISINIMIVDDMDSNITVLEHYINSISPDIILSKARGGEQAVKIYQEMKKFDLIFMDIEMPKMDGLCATRKIKKINRNQLIIGLTGFDDKDKYNECIKVGMTDVVVKPIKLETIESVLNKYVSSYTYIKPKKLVRKEIQIKKNTYEDEIIDIRKQIEEAIMVDKEAALKIFCDDHETMLIGFQDWMNMVKKLKKSLTVKNKTLKEPLHSIKGSSLQLGIIKVGLCAKMAELMLKNGDNNLNYCLKKMKKYIRSTIKQLKKYK